MKPLIDSREFFSLPSQANPSWISTPSNTNNWLPRMAVFSPKNQEPRGDVLVVIFQRGGMDALNAVIPHAETEYYDQRPTLAIAAPKPSDDDSAIDLDGYFGLHPSLRPLKDIWDDHALAIVHACGSPDPTHSHFDAMDFMERGTPGEKQLTSGWLARHLETAAWENQSPFRAVGIGSILQSSLRGPVPAAALQSISSFHLGGRRAAQPLAQFQQSLAQMYAGHQALGPQAALTFNVSDTLASIVDAAYQPAGGAEYPASQFGMGLQQIAQLIKAEVGLEVAAVDTGGWDTHAAQGAIDGVMPALMDDFARGIAAFYKDLGELTQRVTLITMSEFGRRIQENGGGGTDHGHGGAMFVIGKNVNGGQVYTDWPGLSPDSLYGPGDLHITTDFRDVLAEAIHKRLHNNNIDLIFPGHTVATAHAIFKD